MSALTASEADVVVVLVVEDEIFVRIDITEYLENAGYAVIEVGSGEAAIALCNSGTAIDMIITDINLGGSVSGRKWPNASEPFCRICPSFTRREKQSTTLVVLPEAPSSPSRTGIGTY